MKIKIARPNWPDEEIELSAVMQAHFEVPINNANTILEQINAGMYKRWFEGKKGLVVMDFGANVGLTALYFLPACAELYCVEPTPQHYNLLSELMEQNAVGNYCKLYHSALFDKEAKVIFATGHSTENKITSADGHGNGKIEVLGMPLSYYLNEVGKVVDFCKIDIEGGEMVALTEQQLKLAHGVVKTFFVEIHPAFGGGMDENREELIKRFEAAGYQVEEIDVQTIVATC